MKLLLKKTDVNISTHGTPWHIAIVNKTSLLGSSAHGEAEIWSSWYIALVNKTSFLGVNMFIQSKNINMGIRDMRNEVTFLHIAVKYNRP